MTGGFTVTTVRTLESDPDITPDRYRRIDAAQLWQSDMLRQAEPAGAVVGLDVDLSRAHALRSDVAAQGTSVTYTALFVKAAALALARHPHLHQVVGARWRLSPGRVDIGLSVAGEAACAPVMVLDDAGNKSLTTLSDEIRSRTPEVLEKERRELAAWRRWGRLVPWARARRLLVGRMLRRPSFRRRITGTFQVSTMSTVDVLVPLTFVATGVLAAGRVRERVVAVDGVPAVRPMVTLVCAFDHKVWDGARASLFLNEVKDVLELDQLRGDVWPSATA